jgi:hypothetical protein
MYWDGENFGVCSRNWELKEDDTHPAWAIAKNHNIPALLVAAGRPVALQGELIGPGIQGNRYHRNVPEWRLFSVYDIREHAYLDDVILGFLAGTLGLHVCPVVYRKEELPKTIPEIIQLSDIKSKIWPEANAEGIVWRNYSEGKRKYSFKAISNRFLLGEKE